MFYVLCSVAQPCLTLCNPMGCSPSGSSVHGEFQGKNIVMGYHALLEGIFPIKVSHIAGGFFTVWATREAQILYILVPIFTRLKIFLASPAFQALEHMLREELGRLPLWLSTLLVVLVLLGKARLSQSPLSPGLWEPLQFWPPNLAWMDQRCYISYHSGHRWSTTLGGWFLNSFPQPGGIENKCSRCWNLTYKRQKTERASRYLVLPTSPWQLFHGTIVPTPSLETSPVEKESNGAYLEAVATWPCTTLYLFSFFFFPSHSWFPGLYFFPE